MGRPTLILFKGQLPHKSSSLSNDVFCETNGRQRRIFLFLSVLLCHRTVGERGRDPAIHSIAMLNQKKRASAFWVTGDAELPSWSSSNEAFSLRLWQHQGVVEPPGLH